jgi:uncharacterized membrane protein
MKINSVVVATYKSHDEAVAAIKKLQQSGFDMNKLSIVGRDYLTEEHVVGYYNAGDRMKFWGKMGSLWGGLLGFFVGSGFFMIPGIGPLLVAGPLVGMMVGALEGGVVVGSLSVLGAGLYNLGIHKASIAKYEKALKSGKFVVIAHGSAEETAHAREIINQTNPDSSAEHLPEKTDTNIGRWEHSLVP